MREQACATVTELLDEDDRVAVILGEISIPYFREAFRRHPSRVINIGIMEQTMIGVAAGFAMEGFLPVVHTITPFLVERPLEQMKLDFGYQRLGGTFIGVGASYDYSAEGPTHHSPGDVAVLSTISGFEILVPGAAAEVDRLIRLTYANGRPTYVRTTMKQNPSSFGVQPGVMEVVGRGRQTTVIAVGPMLGPVLEATDKLDVTILYATSVLPFDAETLRREAGECVVAVEPFLEGTLAPRITEALADRPARIRCIGVPRRTLEHYGTPEDLDIVAGLDVSQVRSRLEAAIRGA
jgi:transketolase